MQKRFSASIWAAIIFQLLTAALHSLSFFIEPVAANETEVQMLKLMTTYKMDMGNSIYRTYSEIVLTLSVNLTLLCLFGGLLNWFLTKKNASVEIWKGILLIQCIIFGILFLVVLKFGFLPPLIFTGLIFISCITALINVKPIPSL